MHFVRELVVRTMKRFYEAHAPAMAASISYFVLATIAPLAVITLWVGSVLLGAQAARDSVSVALGKLLGSSLGAEMVSLVGAQAERRTARITGLLAVLLLLYGGTALFASIRRALNLLWRVHVVSDYEATWHRHARALALFFAVFVPAIALAALSISLSMLNSVLSGIPGIPIPQIVFVVGTQAIGLMVAWLVAALLMSTLPDARLPWVSIAIGSGFTAVTWALADWGLALYLSSFSMTSRFGAAGAFVALLVWIFLMVRLLLVGALLSYEHARLTEAPVTPRAWADLNES